MKTIILGKRSYLSNKLKQKIISSHSCNTIEFEDFFSKNKNKFNLIINLFYPSSKISDMDSYENFFNISIKNLSSILDKINPRYINKIIYTSSASIYGSVNEYSFLEDPNNRLLYSSTKMLNEILLNNYCQKNKIQLIISRIFNMYGPNENFSIIHKIVESIKNNKKIILFNRGDSIRDFIHVDDICDIYEKFLKTNESSIYDVGSGKGTKIKDIIDFLKLRNNKIIYKKNNISEVNYSIADNSKIKEILNKKTFIKIEEYLKKVVNKKLDKKALKHINKKIPNTINEPLSGAIIYGCGFAGKKIAKKLMKINDNNISYFVDENPALIGKKFLGKVIISNTELLSISRNYVIPRIIIAIPSLTHDELMTLYTRLLPLSLNISSLPQKKNLIGNKNLTVSDLGNLDLGDIIKRKIFDITKNSITNFKDKSILVTGGAGSIGSEIAQQVLRANPKKLLIIDNSEYSLFKVKEKLGLRKNVKYILLDINHQKQIEKIIKDNKIQYIFHAAAYKHVNFLEENIISAVKNNILATLTLLKAIKKTGINLTIISTDKAVMPKNILGMTKRASEIITLSLSRNNDYKNSKISVVRFGNVFGSAGSAVEIFKKQIRNNLPVTLTDVRMKRFFMSIREACNLVLQASQLKYSSSIYVLKMGKPIRILDIINRIFNLIHNKNQKLKIKIIGKFKSEKINERLSNNQLNNTVVKDISLVNEKILGTTKINEFLENLNICLDDLNEKKTINLLKKFTR